jgi:hypothetical protein
MNLTHLTAEQINSSSTAVKHKNTKPTTWYTVSMLVFSILHRTNFKKSCMYFKDLPTYKT